MLGVVFWTAVCAAALLTFVRWDDLEDREILTAVGRTVSDMVLSLMTFDSDHGGIYVVAGEGVKIDKYFKKPGRDLVTTEGLKLTRYDPPFMTAQILSGIREEAELTIRVVGFKGLSPITSPTTFEKEFLREVREKGELLVRNVPSEEGGGDAFFRSVEVTGSCLSCHSSDGFSEGDPIGAFVVYFSPRFLRVVRLGEKEHALTVTAGVWGVGLLLLIFGHVVLSRAFRRAYVREREFRILFEQSLSPVYVAGTDGRLEEANPAFLKLFGYDRDELKVLRDVDLFAEPEVREEFVGSVLERGEVRNFEARMKKSDGSEMRCLISAARRIDSNGEVIGIQGVIRDETERLELIDKLRRFEACVTFSSEAIIITGREGDIQYVNPAFEKITGYVGEEVVGRSLRVIEVNGKEKIQYTDLWNSMEAGEAWTGRVVNRRKDGKLFHADVAVAPILDEMGEVVGFVEVMRDVTRQVEMERQVAAAQRMESVGRLAGILAHDLNNYLGAVMGYCELIKKGLEDRGPADEKFFRYIGSVMRVVDRSRNLLQQVLAFSRRQPAEPRVIDLNEVLSSLCEMLEKLIGEKYSLDLFKEEELWRVKIDPSQMEQVITNLVLNARDAMPDGGVITIETANVVFDDSYLDDHPIVTEKGRYVMLSVTDTGVGIPDDIKEKIFEPFFTTKGEKGTGLGLSTVYGIVKQNGGYIWVYSEVGKGTTFKIYLPATDEPLTRPREEKEEEVDVMGNGELILLIEDNPDIREATTALLSSVNYRVLPAPDGETALLNYADKLDEVSLLITDVVLPKMDGREVADLIRMKNPNIKVLFMSGYTENVIAHEGMIKEGYHFISKPFTAAALWRKVKEVLRS